MGFGGLSRNPFGGNIMSSLTLFRGTSLGFMLFHFPVLGGGVGLMRCATSSLNGSLSSKSSWLLTFYNSNLIN